VRDIHYDAFESLEFSARRIIAIDPLFHCSNSFFFRKVVALRVRLRMSRMVDSADKQVAHGEVDHGFGDVEPPLVVAHEATVACQPTEAALDDPPARQYFEAGLGIEATDDLDDEVEIGRFVEELAPIVGAIGEQMLDPGPTL